MKRLLPAAVGALALLGVLVWRSADRAERGAALGVAQAQATPSAEAEAPLGPAPSEEPRAPNRTAVAPEEESQAPAPEEAPTSAPVRALGFSLSGTITVVDERGIEHPGEDGTFTLYAFEGDVGKGIRTEVRSGAWSAQVAPGAVGAGRAVVGANRMVLGGRPATLDGGRDQRIALEGRTFLPLRARWLVPVVLHVQDHETGRELPEVELIEFRGTGVAHPGLSIPDPVAVADSPLAIPVSEESLRRVFHARSPGHAWGRIEIDPTRTQESFLLLDRCGSLSVALRGTQRDAGARLRVGKLSESSWSGRELVFEAPLDQDDVLEIDSLPAGSYRVSAEVGNVWSDPKVFGEARVEVVAGERAEVTVTLENPEPVTLVPLEGTLDLPIEWGVDEFRLHVKLLDAPLEGRDGRSTLRPSDMLALDGPPGRFHWSAGEVQPGHYELSLFDPPFVASLVVGPEGEHDARIVIQPPCEVLVRCVDDGTDLDVEVDRLLWSPRMPRDVQGIPLQRPTRDANRARWVFRAPQGEIELFTQDMRYEVHHETVEAGPGTNEFVLRLLPATGFLLGLREGDTEVAWDPRWKAALTPVEGRPSSMGLRSTCISNPLGARVLLIVKAPGTYLLTVGEIPGYEPVPEETIELERGTVREHVVELRRRR